jgi:hypothetical protein
MGFLSGRVTYTRFRVSGDGPLPFGDEHLERVQQHAIGRHGAADPTDGVAMGWAGGDHLLDVGFDLDKNIIEDALHLAVRVDADKIPGSLLRAYTQIETDARARLNPSGRPTKAQRVEAKEAARIRAEAEAADGRFRRLAHYPVLWDGRANVLYAGTVSSSVLERLQTLFRATFDRTLEPITAGSLAYALASTRGQERSVEDFGPIGFTGESSGLASVAWTESDASNRDFWGNEFLIWLWHTLQTGGEAITLPDGSEATVMVAKTLTLDCPRGETGRDCLTTEGPTRLPEAFRALQAGKLPRKAGLILVRHGAEYALTLQAETLAVSGALLPKPEDASPSEARVARIESLRHLVETLDLLYDAYGQRRTGPEWTSELGRIRRWLQAA